MKPSPTAASRVTPVQSRSPMATFLMPRGIALYNLTTMSPVGNLDPHPQVEFQLRKVANFKNQTCVAEISRHGGWPPQLFAYNGNAALAAVEGVVVRGPRHEGRRLTFNATWCAWHRRT